MSVEIAGGTLELYYRVNARTLRAERLPDARRGVALVAHHLKLKMLAVEFKGDRSIVLIRPGRCVP